MKPSLLAVLFAVVPTVALAQPMPFTPRMSCAQAALLVRSQGAIVLRTGPGSYDRFVSHSGFCVVAETIEPSWVPTADVAQCFIGYRCVPVDRDDPWRFRGGRF